MKLLGWVALIVGVFVFAVWSWTMRYTTNTAAGRFYKNDRWTGKTLVVEKDGSAHILEAR